MTAAEPPKRPGPPPNPVTAPFWAGLASGALRLQSCRECGRSQHYPRVLCRSCWSDDLEWVDAAGTGTVWTWTVVHRPGHPAWEAVAPYAVLVVELDEGPRLVTGFAGDLTSLRIGLGVRTTTEAREGHHALVAVPVEDVAAQGRARA